MAEALYEFQISGKRGGVSPRLVRSRDGRTSIGQWRLRHTTVRDVNCLYNASFYQQAPGDEAVVLLSCVTS